jgi:hypothetical protein
MEAIIVTPLTGQELLDELVKLTPYQLSFPVVAKGKDDWYCDLYCLKLSNVEKGREQDEEKLNCIALC